MTTNKKRHTSETRRKEQQHLLYLERLDVASLADSCCSICHCDCYSSHGSKNTNASKQLEDIERELKKFECQADDNKRKSSRGKEICEYLDKPKKPNTSKSKKKSSESEKSHHRRRRSSTPLAIKSASQSSANRRNSLPSKSSSKKRSQSASSVNSKKRRTPSPAINSFNTRDCKILQDLLNSLHETPRLEVKASKKEAKMLSFTSQKDNSLKPKTLTKLPPCNPNSQLCSSMASLCLAPTIRKAYELVPTHDKKILNRMAHKRSEMALSKENAWLARKYWENERYEREMLKVEQMEEYKQAVKDKQFQDYLITKARLNELAQRDMAELNRLRACLQDKDERTKKRLETLRIERDILLCQRRTDELRKFDAVNMQQEEHHHDELLRKQAHCQRLTERLQRANQMRSEMLESYLRRLRHDNYMQQLLHEEKWLERQADEQQQRENLKQHINYKRNRSQQFVETRQRRNAILSKNAKISASLRELVRNSVTPEGALLNGMIAGGGAAGVSIQNLVIPAALSQLLDRMDHQM